MATPDHQPLHRPGPISLFFVVKAAVFGAAFWIWLLVLVTTEQTVNGLHLFTASGAVTTTLVSVVLGARLALQRSAAQRHAELRRHLVDISWNAFTAAGNAQSTAKVVPFPGGPYETSSVGGRRNGEDGGRR